MSDDWERVRQVAATMCRAVMPAAQRSSFARAFQRDITVTGYRMYDVVETLGIACRRSLRASHLPGRLVIAADDDRDHIDDVALESFFARGGTLVCQAKPGLQLAYVAGVPADLGPTANGRVEVAGPAIDRLPWKPAVPIAWFDDLPTVRFPDADVLVHDRDGQPLVSRVAVGAGALIHLAWQTVPFRREAEAGGTLTTHRTFAGLLGVAQHGILSTDTAIDFDQLVAEMLAIGILVDIAADVVSQPTAKTA